MSVATLSVIMSSVFVQIVGMPSVVMLGGVILSIVLLNAAKLIGIMLLSLY